MSHHAVGYENVNFQTMLGQWLKSSTTTNDHDIHILPKKYLFGDMDSSSIPNAKTNVLLCFVNMICMTWQKNYVNKILV